MELVQLPGKTPPRERSRRPFGNFFKGTLRTHRRGYNSGLVAGAGEELAALRLRRSAHAEGRAACCAKRSGPSPTLERESTRLVP